MNNFYIWKGKMLKFTPKSSYFSDHLTYHPTFQTIFLTCSTYCLIILLFLNFSCVPFTTLNNGILTQEVKRLVKCLNIVIWA